jgi:hypothetical protein
MPELNTACASKGKAGRRWAGHRTFSSLCQRYHGLVGGCFLCRKLRSQCGEFIATIRGVSWVSGEADAAKGVLFILCHIEGCG